MCRCSCGIYFRLITLYICTRFLNPACLLWSYVWSTSQYKSCSSWNLETCTTCSIFTRSVPVPGSGCPLLLCIVSVIASSSDRFQWLPLVAVHGFGGLLLLVPLPPLAC